MKISKFRSVFCVLAIIALASIAANSQAAVVAPSASSGEDTATFSENQFGAGVFLGYEIDLVKGVFTLEDDEDDYYSENVTRKADDKIFTSIEVFYNYFGDAIDQNYGVSYSIGYAYKKFGVFVNTGYLKTDLTYIEDGISQSIGDKSGFVGAGLRYDINDKFRAKLAFMNYNLSLDPANSTYNKIKIGVRSVTASVGYNF